MPFNGNGTFVPTPAYNPVETDTLISSTAFNATVSDLATALSNCVTRDGQGPIAVDLQMAGHKVVNLGNGTPTTPAILWTAGDGLFRPTPGQVSFAIAGVGVAGVNSGGFDGPIGALGPDSGAFTTLSATGGVAAIGTAPSVQLVRDTSTSGDNVLRWTTQGGLNSMVMYQPAGSADLIMATANVGQAFGVSWATGLVSFQHGVNVSGGQLGVIGNLQVTQDTLLQGRVSVQNVIGSQGYGGELRLIGPSGTRIFRVNPSGNLEIMNNAGTAVTMTIADNGDVYIPGNLIVNGGIYKS